MTNIQAELFKLQDKKYGDFQAGLIPTISRETVIGVRIPLIRKLAKEIIKENRHYLEKGQFSDELAKFLHKLPHKYYEENVLHMLILVELNDYELCLGEIENFLPYIDNWAVCDVPAPKAFKSHKADLLTHIKSWLKSDEPYTVRYAIGMLMRLYLDEDFKVEYLDWVAAVNSEKYYVNMMIAWYFTTALTKQWESSISILTENKLSDWTHNKTIQKARESLCFSKEQKEYLKSLRR